MVAELGHLPRLALIRAPRSCRNLKQERARSLLERSYRSRYARLNELTFSHFKHMTNAALVARKAEVKREARGGGGGWENLRNAEDANLEDLEGRRSISPKLRAPRVKGRIVSLEPVS